MGYMWENSMGDMQMKQAIHDYAVSGLGIYMYILMVKLILVEEM